MAIDDSRFSEAAIRFLSEQAQPHENEVRVSHVVEPPLLLVNREMCGYDSDLLRIPQSQIEQAEALVGRVAERLRCKSAKVTTCIVQGDPKSEILDETVRWVADLLVIGSHGRTSFARFFLGSVSDVVARHARCSVEVVRSGPSY